jgi:hypothetical protein
MDLLSSPSQAQKEKGHVPNETEPRRPVSEIVVGFDSGDTQATKKTGSYLNSIAPTGTHKSHGDSVLLLLLRLPLLDRERLLPRNSLPNMLDRRCSECRRGGGGGGANGLERRVRRMDDRPKV